MIRRILPTVVFAPSRYPCPFPVLSFPPRPSCHSFFPRAFSFHGLLPKPQYNSITMIKPSSLMACLPGGHSFTTNFPSDDNRHKKENSNQKKGGRELKKIMRCKLNERIDKLSQKIIKSHI